MKTISTFRTVGLAIAIWLVTASAAKAFYNPIVGRWLSRDPIGEEGGQNLYGFVANTPINAVDQLGLVIVGFLQYGLRHSGPARRCVA